MDKTLNEQIKEVFDELFKDFFKKQTVCSKENFTWIISGPSKSGKSHIGLLLSGSPTVKVESDDDLLRKIEKAGSREKVAFECVNFTPTKWKFPSSRFVEITI